MHTVYLAADHAGFDMKNSVRDHLEAKGVVVEDCGAYRLEPDDDYPAYAAAAAEAVREHEGSFGVLSCGSAEGICIAANKFDGIRAGIGYSIAAAKSMRSDEDANVICIPGRLHTQDDPLAIIDAFLSTPFSKAIRHERRLAQVQKIERDE